MIGVVGCALLSVRFSQHPHLSLAALPAVLGDLAIFVLATGVSPKKFRIFGICWLAAAVVMSVVGVLRGGTGPDFVSVIGNRNFVGAYLAASVCITASLWHQPGPIREGGCKEVSYGAWNAGFFIAMCLLMAALCLCRSRGAWLALAIVAMMTLVLLAPGAPILKWGGALALIVIVTVLGHVYINQQWQTDVRPMIWKGTLEMISARPLLGHGLDVFRIDYTRFRPPEYFLRPKAVNLTDHAHNEMLETAAEQGLLGLGARLWLWIAVFRLAMQSWRTDKDPAQRGIRLGLMGAALVFVLHGMVDVDLRHPPNQTLLWLVLGLMISDGQSQPVLLTVRSLLARSILAICSLVVAVAIAWASVIEPVRADWWERRSRVSNSRGDYQTAVTAAEKALEIDPLRLETRYFLAGLFASAPGEEQHRRAIQECLRIEELAPDYADITYNLGQLFLSQRQPGAALPFLQRAVQLNPYNADKRIRLGVALDQLGDVLPAREQWEAALQLHPGDPAIKTLLAHDQPSTQP